MDKIRNRDTLLDHGDRIGRRVLLDITEELLRRLDAYHQIRALMDVEGDRLRIGATSWDLTRHPHVYLVGAGKAVNAMARAVDEVLGDRLTEGIVIAKVIEDTDHYHRTTIRSGGHPLPNAAGHAASREILDLVDRAEPDDLFIAVISGGSSALMNYPVSGISIEDEAAATDVLLNCGAGIYEINSIRRHVSQTNGGRLAERIQRRGAHLVGIGISDAVGNPPTHDVARPVTNYSSTPIGPDRTTLDDARQVIDDYGLEELLPASVISFLRSAGPEHETPKAFPDNTYFVLNTVGDTCPLAQQIASELGHRAYTLTAFLEGESKDVGQFLSAVARQAGHGGPFDPPCVIMTAGEANTTIPDPSRVAGHGGPGQEMVLGFALTAHSLPGVCLISIDTEGTDGTTSVAGGIADSTTRNRADAAGVSLRQSLRAHASYEALHALRDTVITGNTGTNLCDFNALYVPARPDSHESRR